MLLIPKLSTEAKQTRIDKIIYTSLDLFSEKGYSGTSMDDIVRATGFSKGAIYNYFKSKEEIFLAISEISFNKRKDLVKNFPHNMPCKDKIINYIKYALIRFSEDDTIKSIKFWFEFWSIISRDPNKSHLSLKRYNSLIEDLSSIIKEGIDKGEFKENIDTSSICYIILSFLDGIAFHSGVIGVQAKEEMINLLTEMILNLLIK